MTTVASNLVDEAKKNKYCGIGPALSDADVSSVWDNVSSFIEKQMLNQKGVTIPGLGIFTFSQKKLDIGNNKYLILQRPIFQLLEKFAQTHGVTAVKHYTPGQVPVVNLNFAALSVESPFDRDTVETCVKEVLAALSRTVAAKKNVEFTFNGIGRLNIRGGRVKMRFYKEFMNSLDQSGKLVDALQNRPGTVDSVMSDRALSRAVSRNTILLPSLKGSGGDSPRGAGGRNSAMPIIHEDIPEEFKREIYEDMEQMPTPRLPSAFNEVQELEKMGLPGELMRDKPYGDIDMLPDTKKLTPLPPSRAGSRMAAPMAKASGVSLSDDFMIPSSPRMMSRASSVMKSSPAPLAAIHESCNQNNTSHSSSGSLPPLSSKSTSHKPATPMQYERTMGSPRESPRPITSFQQEDSEFLGVGRSRTKLELERLPSRTDSQCGHLGAGQELCYLCHQRDRMNIPVSFTAEKKQRELEEDRLLQQYQHLKDGEAILKEQENNLAKRHENQKTSAFNLGVAEAVKQKQQARPTEFHKSYVFQKRPLTPPRYIKQNELSGDLMKQVESKKDQEKKRKADESFLERLEQVQLAEDLAAQREQYLKQKADQTDQYKRALSAQIKSRKSLDYTASGLSIRVKSPLHSVYSHDRRRFSPSFSDKTEDKQVRFKPLPIPARQPDSSEAIFGKGDMTNEKLFDKHQRARDLLTDQLDIVAQRKRDAILKKLHEQKEDEDVIKRSKDELRADRAARYERLYVNRKKIEEDWMKAAEEKKQRELEDKLHSLDAGILVHEQCDRYKRCNQCKRKLANGGESNIWMESRYIPGSRIMV